MKSRVAYMVKNSDLKQEVVKEFKRQEQQLAENFTYQTVANILYILEKQGEKDKSTP